MASAQKDSRLMPCTQLLLPNSLFCSASSHPRNMRVFLRPQGPRAVRPRPDHSPICLPTALAPALACPTLAPGLACPPLVPAFACPPPVPALSCPSPVSALLSLHLGASSCAASLVPLSCPPTPPAPAPRRPRAASSSSCMTVGSGPAQVL